MIPDEAEIIGALKNRRAVLQVLVDKVRKVWDRIGKIIKKKTNSNPRTSNFGNFYNVTVQTLFYLLRIHVFSVHRQIIK